MVKTLQSLPGWLRFALMLPLLFLNGFLISLLVKYLEPLVSFIIIASILAFLLELGAELLIQRGIKRGLAITIVVLFMLVLLTVLGFILIPLIIEQLGQVIDSAPQWIQGTNQQLESFFNSPFLQRLSIDLNAILIDIKKQIALSLKSFGGELLDIVAGTINSFINALLVLVLTIFLLIGGDKFWQGIFSYFPAPWNQKIPQYTRKTFKDYFLARLTLTAIASTARWILLSIFGVPYAVLFGFGLGLAGFVPFLGTVLSLIAFVVLCFKSIGFGLKFLVISVLLDQINDNVLAPKIMGNAIGLNPVWLIISLFIGVKVGGILGLFLAVPVASLIKQITDDFRSQLSDNSHQLISEASENIEKNDQLSETELL